MTTKTKTVRMTALAGALFLAGCASQTRQMFEPTDFALRQRGDAAFDAGNIELARTEYIQYNQMRPGRAEIYHKLAICNERLGRSDEALQNHRLAGDLEPDNVEYVESLAEALVNANEFEEAYELLRWRTEQPGLASDYIRLGRFALKMGDADEAETALRTAARIDGGRTIEPHLALADFYRTIGDADMELLRLKMALFVDLTNEEVNARLRERSLIPGPTLAVMPEEMAG
jgi:tetratricopeptide (TPR) repeat protein